MPEPTMKRRGRRVANRSGSANGSRPRGATALRDIDLELIENLPAGLALIEMCNPEDARTWRLTASNAIARQAIGDTSLIDFLLSRMAPFPFKKKMEDVYQQVLQWRRPKELRWIAIDWGGARRAYSVTAFSVPPKHIGLRFQDESMHSDTRTALAEHKIMRAEVGRVAEVFLWRGDPLTLQTTYVSSEAKVLLGYWPEHWTNFPNFWLDHVHPDDRERVAKLARDGMLEETRFDYRMRAADGSEKWLYALIRGSETAAGRPELAGVMLDITARKEAEELVHELTGQLLESQDEERRHVARELHDSLGQSIAVLGLNIARLSRSVPALDDEQRRLFTETADLVETCSQEVRTMSYLMHPPMLDEVGLGSALNWFATGFSERSGIQVEIHAAEDVKQLPKRVELAFFRIAQAGLTNVYRHSGSSEAEVHLRRDRDGVTLEIVDHGHGFDEGKPDGEPGESKGVGIRGMKERMRELGGTLEVTSGASGTVVRARIPNKSKAFAAKSKEEKAHFAAAGGRTTP